MKKNPRLVRMMKVGDDTEERKGDGRVRLRRKIGLMSAMSMIVGAVVGSGIFIAPKGVLMNTGSVGLSLLVWTLCGLLSLFGALCFAELGTTFTKSGGQYTYLLEILGPLPAFLRLWTEFFFIRPAVTGYIALAFGQYLVEPFFSPCVPPLLMIKLVAVLGVTFVTVVNCWSVTLATRTQVILAIIKTSALVLIIVPGIIALAKGKTENFHNAFEVEVESFSMDKLPLAFFHGLYAYAGWFFLNCVTEEVINPNRNIPLAISCSIVMVTVLYVLANVAYYTMMTPVELLLSDAVALSFAKRAAPALACVIPVLVALSCLGALNGGLFSAPRMMFVGGREGHWPKIFSMIHIRKNTPLPAVLFQYPLVVLMISKGEIHQLINFASFSRWFFIAMTTLAMLIHRYRFPHHPRPFKVPLFIPITFTVVCFFIVSLSLYSDPANTGWSCALTLTGLPVYYLTIPHFYLPKIWRRGFNYCSKQLQILLEVAQQEVQTH